MQQWITQHKRFHAGSGFQPKPLVLQNNDALKRNDMRKHKSSLSQEESCKGIGEFWDTHDLSDFWDRTKESNLEVGIKSETTYYAGDKKDTDNKSGDKSWK